MNTLIDKVDEFAERHGKLLSLIGVAWLALTSAIYARFITLPDWIDLDDTVVLVSGIVYNAGWWGFLYPRIEQHRKDRQSVIGEGAKENG